MTELLELAKSVSISGLGIGIEDFFSLFDTDTDGFSAQLNESIIMQESALFERYCL